MSLFYTLLCMFVVCFSLYLFEDLLEVRSLKSERAFLHKKEEEGKWEQRLVHRRIFDIQTGGYVVVCCLWSCNFDYMIDPVYIHIQLVSVHLEISSSEIRNHSLISKPCMFQSIVGTLDMTTRQPTPWDSHMYAYHLTGVKFFNLVIGMSLHFNLCNHFNFTSNWVWTSI